MNTCLAILWKDLVTEWRSRERVVAMLLFSLLVVVVFHFALPTGTQAGIRENAAGLLWVAYVFASNMPATALLSRVRSEWITHGFNSYRSASV